MNKAVVRGYLSVARKTVPVTRRGYSLPSGNSHAFARGRLVIANHRDLATPLRDA
jgi:hypothetical protein